MASVSPKCRCRASVIGSIIPRQGSGPAVPGWARGGGMLDRSPPSANTELAQPADDQLAQRKRLGYRPQVLRFVAREQRDRQHPDRALPRQRDRARRACRACRTEHRSRTAARWMNKRAWPRVRRTRAPRGRRRGVPSPAPRALRRRPTSRHRPPAPRRRSGTGLPPFRPVTPGVRTRGRIRVRRVGVDVSRGSRCRRRAACCHGAGSSLRHAIHQWWSC